MYIWEGIDRDRELDGNCEDPPWVSEGIGFGGHVRKCGPN